MLVQEAKKLCYGQYAYHTWIKKVDGQPLSGRVVSIRTWIKQPDRIRVGLKIGFSNHVYLQNNNLQEWVLIPDEAYREKQFTVQKGHIEIKPEYCFATQKGEGELVYKYAIRAYLCIKGCNKPGLILEKAISVPAHEFPNKGPMSITATLRRGTISMKRQMHKLFDKQSWGDLHAEDEEVIGIRTI
jgi:hypothetical protein